MSPWIFSIKFPYDTQFIFGSLMFTVGEDENFELLTWRPAPIHHASVYGIAPYYPVDPSISSGACSCLNPHTGPYYLSAMTSQGLPIGKTIFQSSDGTLSSSSLGQLLIEIPSKTTLRSGVVPTGTCHRGLLHQHGGFS
jgi:hypothetical protein